MFKMEIDTEDVVKQLASIETVAEDILTDKQQASEIIELHIYTMLSCLQCLFRLLLLINREINVERQLET